MGHGVCDGDGPAGGGEVWVGGDVADAVAEGWGVSDGVTLGATVDVGGRGVPVAGGVAEGGVELGLLVGEAVVGAMDAVAVGVCDGTILVAVAEGDGPIGLGVAEGVRVSVEEGVAEGVRVGV